jgi:hydrogenase expression/formation protein HypE
MGMICVKSRILSEGKVPHEVLRDIIFNNKNKNNLKREEILIRPSIGEDCSAFFLKDELCIISTDPITGTTEDIGYLSVMVNVNDIASSGGEAIGVMTTILLPIGTTENELLVVINGIYKGCKESNIEVMGGHTEVTDAVNRIVVTNTIVGKSKNKKFVSTSGAKVGESVVMTKLAAIEGTSIMLKSMTQEDKNNLNIDCKSLINKLDKMLSVAIEGGVGCDFNVSSMHDITEGGVLGGCYEVAQASNVGININLDVVKILEETVKICKKFNINPYKLISSGAMLMTTSNPDKLLKKLKEHGVEATVIGIITEKDKTYTIQKEIYEMDEIETDELYKFLKEI